MSPPEDHPSLGVMIGLQQIYDKLISLGDQLGILTGAHTGTAARVADHEQRLRLIEANRWPVSPVTMVVSVFALLVAVAALLIPMIN